MARTSEQCKGARAEQSKGRTSKQSLATKIARLRCRVEDLELAHVEGAHYDAGFDGGEFSGPAHWRQFQRDADALARRYGFDTYELALRCGEVLR